MEREKYISEFCKGLRVALTNASTYFPDHPLFVRSISELKQKIDALFTFVKPLRMGVTTNALFIDGSYWEKERLYSELACLLHRRKVKTLTITPLAAQQDLAALLTVLSLKIEDVIAGGGMQALLEKRGVKEIVIEELDYSQFLKGLGDEAVEDIWESLLRESEFSFTQDKVAQFIEHFDAISRRFTVADFLEDALLRDNLARIMAYIRSYDTEEFRRCAKKLMQVIVGDKGVDSRVKLSGLAAFFVDMGTQDVVDSLWDEILTSDEFNPASFNLFSQLLGTTDQGKGVRFLGEKIKKDASANPYIHRRIKEMLSAETSSQLPPAYRDMLTEFARTPVKGGIFLFDRSGLTQNYSTLLLNLLAVEKDAREVATIIARIIQDWDTLSLECTSTYVKQLHGILCQKKETCGFVRNQESDDNCGVLEEKIFAFVESSIVNGDDNGDFAGLVPSLKKSSLGVQVYLDLICKQHKVSRSLLALFFSLAPESKDLFITHLKLGSPDIQFLKAVIEAIPVVRYPLSKELLKDIFLFVNDFLRVEAVKAMKDLPGCDEEFLNSLVHEKSFLLRREALSVLVSQGKASPALKRLLRIPNPLGLRNRLMLDSLQLISEVHATESAPELEDIFKRLRMWHAPVKKKIAEMLRRWQKQKVRNV